MASSQQHVVMLPFMAKGHLIPFLALATQIHQRTGFTITIANTPLNIKYLQSTVSATATTTTAEIHLVEIPFNLDKDSNLPPNTENTEALTLDQLASLFRASLSLQTPFHQLISSITQKQAQPLICIISDVFCAWTLDVAKVFGIPNIIFTTGGAYGTAAYMTIWRSLPHRYVESNEFVLPGFPDTCMIKKSDFHRYLLAADGTDEWSKFFQLSITKSLESDGWLCNTVEEIEVLGLDILRRFAKLPVWSIGPLLPHAMLTKSSRVCNESSLSSAECIDWLNKQLENSVLYISFGSQNTITTSQMMELAMGLEDSEKPFIWVIRPPLGFNIKGEFRDEWLPKGFKDRMMQKKLGLLVHNWGPQLEILSHKSTGVFLSHCGWNSTLESLSQGVAIIGWPMMADQTYNSKILVDDMGVSIELARGLKSCIDAKEVKRVIELAMSNEVKGAEMKKNAVEIREKIREAVREEGVQKGSSVRAMDDFLSTILSKRMSSFG